jgi:hypothetical protein
LDWLVILKTNHPFLNTGPKLIAINDSRPNKGLKLALADARDKAVVNQEPMLRNRSN